MKAILAGLGRTGTNSLKRAFEALDLRVLSQFELIPEPERLRQVLAAARGEAPLDPGLFSGIDATMGWPLCWTVEEQLALFPEAKVILNVRDPDRWFESVNKAMPVLSKVRRLRFIPKVALMDAMLELLDERMGGPLDRARWVEGYRRHVDGVKQAIPKDRLLIYELGEGWDPICDFLDLAVPDMDFPRGNSSRNDEFAANVKRLLGGR